MDLELVRFFGGTDDSLGLLFDISGGGRRWLCFTLEDEARTVKVYGETRIPAGTYKIKLRQEGGFHQRYQKRFPGIHRGMLELQDVPGFKYVLIHIGNDDDDTAGCILVGDQAKRGFIGQSAAAYRRVYQEILGKILEGELVRIHVVDWAV